jgi:hypothetical protein
MSVYARRLSAPLAANTNAVANTNTVHTIIVSIILAYEKRI